MFQIKLIGISSTWLTVLIVDLLATSGDITATWTSPMYEKLYSNDTEENPFDKPISLEEGSWLSSLLTIGAICGSLPIGLISDKIGRKNALLLIAVPHIVAFCIYAFATNIYLFYVGRLLNGFSEGAGYAILPMYIAEISEDHNRAGLSLTLNIFWTIGNFLPYGVGPYLSVQTFNLILVIIPSLFFLCFLFVGTETPHYLIRQGEYEKAVKAIIWLRSKSKHEAQKEVDKLKVMQVDHHDGNLSEIFTSPQLRKALIISVILMILQQLSGINAIASYMQPIFEAAETNISPAISSTICGALNIISSLIAAFILEHTGKKWPLAVSCLGDALFLIALGVFFYIKEQTDLSTENIHWLPLVSILGYIFFFNMGFVVLPWTISAELFPNHVKAVSSSIITGSSWSMAFLVTKFFNLATEHLHNAGTFWLFGGSCLFSVIFCILWVPETKGKSFVEIQEMLNK